MRVFNLNMNCDDCSNETLAEVLRGIAESIEATAGNVDCGAKLDGGSWRLAEKRQYKARAKKEA